MSQSETPGFKLDASVGLKGRVMWHLVREGKVIQGGHLQDNLITDGGLDNYGLYGVQMRSKAHISTGSTPPAFTDIAMSNTQNAIATATLTTNTATTRADAANNRIEFDLTRTFIFNITQAINATEFGFSPNNTTSPLSIRQLFRDAGGNPVTISALPNDRIELTHILTVQVGPYGLQNTRVFTLRSLDRQGNLIENLEFPGVLTWQLTTSEPSLDAVQRNLDPTFTYSGYNSGSANNGLGPMITDNVALSLTSYNGLMTYPTSMSVDPYINGSYSAKKRMFWNADAGNLTAYGFRFAYGNYSNQTVNTRHISLTFKFDSGVTFTKDNLHTLEVEVELNWGRAP